MCPSESSITLSNFRSLRTNTDGLNIPEDSDFSVTICYLRIENAEVWKHECRYVRKGGLSCWARTLFSTMVHSTSSSWITTSFFRIFIAYSSSVAFISASMTFRTHLTRVFFHNLTLLRPHREKRATRTDSLGTLRGAPPCVAVSQSTSGARAAKAPWRGGFGVERWQRGVKFEDRQQLTAATGGVGRIMLSSRGSIDLRSEREKVFAACRELRVTRPAVQSAVVFTQSRDGHACKHNQSVQGVHSIIMLAEAYL
ncbi:hypothetical protein EYF80_046964 [Liparis tanakae]|uniref:Uncharacterized protein n=1 Tax=Liparis tanakae TaxID=230148 RepID=A0A4Z2FP84_9TELE|nr:hypothetical protein EYF80_046964 [Liparis tanakae]